MVIGSLRCFFRRNVRVVIFLRPSRALRPLEGESEIGEMVDMVPSWIR